MSQIGPAPLGGDVDRGPEALVICWVMTAMGILVVLMRFVGRRMMRSTGPDDWMMLLTLVGWFPSPNPECLRSSNGSGC